MKEVGRLRGLDIDARELRAGRDLEYFTNQLVKSVATAQRPLDRDEMDLRKPGRQQGDSKVD